MSEGKEEVDPELLGEKLDGIMRSLRMYMDRVNYYMAHSHKSAMYSQIEKIRDLIFEYIKNNDNGAEEIDLSSFGEAYSNLMATISSTGAVSDSSSRNALREDMRDFMKSITYVEMKLKGMNVSSWSESSDEDTLNADDLAELMTR